MRKILYTRADGGVSVVHPAIGAGELLLEAEAEQRAWDKLPDDAINPQFVDDVPFDRTFRNAWIQDGKSVTHDLAKAKTIAHEKRRADRAEAFKPLDIEATIPALSAQAEAKRQVIRDATAARQIAIDAASDIDTLKALM